MKASILISSHGRPKYLAEAIKSIKKINTKNYELIVVESSPEPLPKNIQKLCTKYIHNPNYYTSCTKRNVSIKNASGDILIFTDDDVDVHKEWANEILKGFEIDQKIYAVVGNTLPAEGYATSEYEKYFSFTRKSAKPKIIKKSLVPLNFLRFGHGNNMAFRREFFKKYGLFDLNLGIASKGMAGDDTDMLYRVIKNNFSIYFNPKAIIHHKHLLKKEDLPKNAYRNGIAGYHLLKKYFPDWRYTLFYAVVILNLIRKYLISKDKSIIKQSLRGWLGYENNPN